jgi:hypothetical protein
VLLLAWATTTTFQSLRKAPSPSLSSFVQGNQHKAIQAWSKLAKDFAFSRALLVSIRATKQTKEGIFAPNLLTLNQQLTHWLKQHRHLTSVLSLAPSLSISKGNETLIVKKVLDRPANTLSPSQRAAIRAHILRDPLYRGSLVSADAQATLLLFQLKPKLTSAQRRQTLYEVENKLRALQKQNKNARLGWIGAPAVAHLAADSVTKDLKAFLPIVLGLFFLLLLLAIRQWRQRFLFLAGWGLFVTVGVSGFLGMTGQWVATLAWLPLLGWWTLAIAQLTTKDPSSGPFSLAPTTSKSALYLAILGGICATTQQPLALQLGTVAAWAGVLLLAITRIIPAQPAHASTNAQITSFLRIPSVGWFVLCALALGTIQLKWTGTPNTLNRHIPTKSSPFLWLQEGHIAQTKHFKGATPIFLRFRGDMRDPIVLKAVERLSRRLEAHPTIHAPQSIGALIRHLNSLLGQSPRIPDKRNQIQMLWSFLDGRPELKSLVRKQGKDAILQARLQLKDQWKQRHILAFIEQSTASLPTHYRTFAFRKQSHTIQKQLVQYRSQWITEGILLWVKRHSTQPLPDSLLLPIASIIQQAVIKTAFPPKQFVLNSTALRKQLWVYLSGENCDLEIKQKSKQKVLLQLLIANQQGALLSSESIRACITKGIKGTKAESDKASIKYAVRSLVDIVNRLYKQQVTRQTLQGIFGQFRKQRAWLLGFSKDLGDGVNHPNQRIAEAEAELQTLFSRSWYLPTGGKQKLHITHTGLQAITIPNTTQAVRMLQIALVAFSVIGLFVLALFGSDKPSRWILALGPSSSMLALLGALGWVSVPITLPIAWLVVGFGLLQGFASMQLTLTPPQTRDIQAWERTMFWFSLPFLPLLFATTPLLVHLGWALLLGPIIALGSALWMGQLAD